MRLGDLDALREDWLENGENEYVYDTNSFLASIDEQPTIDPETLPIVRQLREENEKLKHDLSDSFTAYLLDKLNKVETELEAIKMNPPVQLDGNTFDLACRLAKVTAERDTAVNALTRVTWFGIMALIPAGCVLTAICRCTRNMTRRNEQ